MIKKVAIIGSGNVGATIAHSLIMYEACDEIMLYDLNVDLAYAQMLDLQDTLLYIRKNINILVCEINDLSKADIIVYTASKKFVLGQTRLDMLSGSIEIVNELIPKVMRGGFNGIFLVVTNPVDIIAYQIYKISKLSPEKIIGTGTALDTNRLKHALSCEFKVNGSDVDGYVIGEHGDSQVIAWSETKIGNKCISNVCKSKDINLADLKIKIEKNIKKSGWEIANTKKTTNYGISAVVVDIIKSLGNNEKKVIVVSNIVKGKKDTFISWPFIVGRSGVESMVVLNLTKRESIKFEHSYNILTKEIARYECEKLVTKSNNPCHE